MLIAPARGVRVLPDHRRVARHVEGVEEPVVRQPVDLRARAPPEEPNALPAVACLGRPCEVVAGQGDPVVVRVAGAVDHACGEYAFPAAAAPAADDQAGGGVTVAAGAADLDLGPR